MSARMVWVQSVLAKVAIQLGGLAAVGVSAALLMGLSGRNGLLAVVMRPEVRPE